MYHSLNCVIQTQHRKILVHPIYEYLPRESSARRTALFWTALVMVSCLMVGCQDAKSSRPLQGHFTGLLVAGTPAQPSSFIPCIARTQRWYITGDSISFLPGESPYSASPSLADSLSAFSAFADSVFDTRATLSAQQQLTIDRTVTLPPSYRPYSRSFSPDTVYRLTIGGYTSNRTNIPSSVGLYQRVLVVDTLYDVLPDGGCSAIHRYGL